MQIPRLVPIMLITLIGVLAMLALASHVAYAYTNLQDDPGYESANGGGVGGGGGHLSLNTEFTKIHTGMVSLAVSSDAAASGIYMWGYPDTASTVISNKVLNVSFWCYSTDATEKISVTNQYGGSPTYYAITVPSAGQWFWVHFNYVVGASQTQTYFYIYTNCTAAFNLVYFDDWDVHYTDNDTASITPAFSSNVTSGTVPFAVQFNDTTTGGSPSAWYWNFSDGTGNSTLQNATHVFSNAGTYTVMETVTVGGANYTVSHSNYITANAASTPTVQFNLSSYSFNENAGTVTLNVSKNGTGACSVNFYTANGNASSGTNYVANSGTLSFASGDASKTFTVNFTNDGKYDTAKFFYANLTTNSSCNIGANNTTTIWVQNTDSAPSFQFNNVSYVGNEGASITFNVTKTGATNMASSVNFFTSNGNATSGTNYVANSGTLSFSASDINKTFTVNLTDDGKYDVARFFYANLTTQVNGSIGTNATTKAWVQNIDASPVFQFNASSYEFNETAGTVTINVTKTGATNLASSVQYATHNGNATSGTNYNTASGTLSFASGDTSKTFTVVLLDDHVVTAQLFLYANLSAPVNGSLGAPNVSTILMDNVDTAPVAGFTGTPPSGVVPLQVTFTNSSTGYPSTWAWNFGDGTANVTTHDPTHQYNNSGVYTVMLTVTNTNGSSTLSRTNYINAISQTMPSAGFTATPTSGLSPLQVTFTNSSTGYPSTWTWNFGDGTANVTTHDPTHQYNNSGIYTVMLTVSNSNGSSTFARTNYINVIAPTMPTASFAGSPTSGVVPLQVAFTDASTGYPATWNWSFGDGTANVTTQSPTHLYNSSGVYTVMLTVTNANGSSTLALNGYINVIVPTPTTASFTEDITSGDAPLTVSFADTSSGYPTGWDWNFGDGTANDTTQYPVHEYDTPGVYTVMLTATNANGSDTSAQYGIINVTVPPLTYVVYMGQTVVNVQQSGIQSVQTYAILMGADGNPVTIANDVTVDYVVDSYGNMSLALGEGMAVHGFTDYAMDGVNYVPATGSITFPAGYYDGGQSTPISFTLLDPGYDLNRVLRVGLTSGPIAPYDYSYNAGYDHANTTIVISQNINEEPIVSFAAPAGEDIAYTNTTTISYQNTLHGPDQIPYEAVNYYVHSVYGDVYGDIITRTTTGHGTISSADTTGDITVDERSMVGGFAILNATVTISSGDGYTCMADDWTPANQYYLNINGGVMNTTTSGGNQAPPAKPSNITIPSIVALGGMLLFFVLFLYGAVDTKSPYGMVSHALATLIAGMLSITLTAGTIGDAYNGAWVTLQNQGLALFFLVAALLVGGITIIKGLVIYTQTKMDGGEVTDDDDEDLRQDE